MNNRIEDTKHNWTDHIFRLDYELFKTNIKAKTKRKKGYGETSKEMDK
jgi:hypothetical protein